MTPAPRDCLPPPSLTRAGVFSPRLEMFRYLASGRIRTLDDAIMAAVAEGASYADAWGALVDLASWPHTLCMLCDGVPCIVLIEPFDQDEMRAIRSTRPPPRRRQ